MHFRFYENVPSKCRDTPIIEKKNDAIFDIHVRNINILVFCVKLSNFYVFRQKIYFQLENFWGKRDRILYLGGQLPPMLTPSFVPGVVTKLVNGCIQKLLSSDRQKIS